jgi:hypothetical protein
MSHTPLIKLIVPLYDDYTPRPQRIRQEIAKSGKMGGETAIDWIDFRLGRNYNVVSKGFSLRVAAG